MQSFVQRLTLFIVLSCLITTLLGKSIGTLTQSEVILFTSDRDGDADLYLMDLDAGLVVRVLDTAVHEGQASISPDGTRIAYTVNLPMSRIYVLDLRDNRVTTLPALNNTNLAPVWSPDSTQIALSSGSIARPDLSIYWIDALTGEVRGLLPDVGAENRISAWQGERFLFAAIASETWAIFETGMDGSAARLIADLPGGDLSAKWSPDGTQIVFMSYTLNAFQVYSMRADGSHVQQLTFTQGSSGSPMWSPDGRYILYTTSVDFRTREIFIMDTDGQNKRRLTFDSWDDVVYGWMP
jgi:TolB protein